MVQITWTEPNINGATITEYRVEIATLDANGARTGFNTVTACSGPASGTNITRICNVTMATLMSSTYNYKFDNLVVVRVTAANFYGFGPTSAENTDGARIR